MIHHMIALNILLMILLGAVSAWTGVKLGKRKGRAWVFGFAIPLGVLGLTAIALNFRRPEFIPPFSWLLDRDNEWLVLTACVPMILGVLAARANMQRVSGQRKQGWVLHVLSAVVVLRSGVLPAFTPLLTEPELQNIITNFDMDGVCLQSTGYNCGPAAAVTALRHLGIDAREGAMALRAQTNSVTGTDDANLERAMLTEYGKDGLMVKRCYLDSAEGLKEWPTAIALIKLGFLVDHYVTVLGFEGENIIIGDPLIGRVSMPVAEFEGKWRHVAMLMRRDKR